MELLPSFFAAPRKGRVLFVDDDEMVLHGLRRALHPFRREWDFEFHASAAGVLAALDRTPCDVIVSDMRMPGTSGARLLADVASRHPGTVRIVLSGQTDQSLVMQCADLAHQCLCKPCDPATLVETIRRTLTLRETLGDAGLRSLVSRIEALPTKPDLYLEIVCKLQEPGATVGEIAAVIERDIAMTAKVLRLVNSAFFGHPQRMANIAEAVSYLGLDTIRTLVLAIDVLEQFRGGARPPQWLGDMWEHAYHVACTAREIARRERQDRQVIDEAFAGGLLHDAGKLVFALNFPDEYEACFGEGCRSGEPSCGVEERHFGASHPLVGAHLFGLWGLPSPVVEAVAFHHCPRRSPSRGFTALTAVHVADALVHRFDPAGAAPGGGLLDAEYLEEVGLSGHLPDWEGVV